MAVVNVRGIEGPVQVFAPALNPYVGARPLTGASTNVSDSPAIARLLPGAGERVFITGFTVSGCGADAAQAVSILVEGVTGGTLSYAYAFAQGANVANQTLSVHFLPALPAEDEGVVIEITCPASGAGGTHNAIVATGYCG